MYSPVVGLHHILEEHCRDDVSSGELLIDGVNIKDYSLRSVRDHISIVTQEPILFNDTIENNILLGKQNATQNEIEEAAKVANAYTFITKSSAVK